MQIRRLIIFVSGLALISCGSIFSQTNPVEVWHTNEFPGYLPDNPSYQVEDVVVSGHYAFVANIWDGSYIYDTQNAPSLKLLGIALSGQTVDQVVTNNLLFQANKGYGLQIFDVSTPTNPVALIRTNLPNCYCGSLAVSGNYVFIADQNNGLLIYDVSNLSSPVLVGQTNTSSYDEGVAVSGKYAYVSTFIDGLHVFDITNVTNPVQVARIDTGGESLSGYQMDIRSPYLYLADGWDGLHIFDISEPTNPISAGRVSLGQNLYAQHVEIAGNFAYVVEYYTGLRICDISDPTNPILLPGTNNTYGANPLSLAVSSNFVYLANGGDGLRIYSLSTPSSPSVKINQNSSNIAVTWPTPSAAFVLQQSPDLSGTNWQSLTNSALVASNQNQITLPAGNKPVFFRLRFP